MQKHFKQDQSNCNLNDTEFSEDYGVSDTLLGQFIVELEKPKKGFVKEYIVYFDTIIESPDNYRRLINLLRTSTEKDLITLVLITDGGSLATFKILYYYLLNCKAHIIAEIHEAVSCGALIAMCSDEIKYHDFSTIVIHDIFITDAVGRIKNLSNMIGNLMDLSNEIYLNLFKGFLTEKELKELHSGEEFYFDSKSISSRLKKWVPYRKIKKGGK